MFKIVKKEIEWAGRTLSIETGKIARQADGAVIVKYGETIVMCTAVSAKSPKPDIDFLPLTVHYREMAFAVGKIPGGFFKREGRPSEREILISRLIDRPIRPLFAENFYNETQIICTLLSHDMFSDSDVISIIGSAAALAIAGVPFEGPIAAAKVGYTNGQYVLNPAMDKLSESELDLVVAGTESSVLMVESEAQELSEEVMLGGVMFGHQAMQPVIQMIKEFAEMVGVQHWKKPEGLSEELYDKVKVLAESGLREAYRERAKLLRREKIDVVKKGVLADLVEQGFKEVEVAKLLKRLEENIVRHDIVENNFRIDGRDSKTVRPIECEVTILPKTHGSSLFTRGETQALVVTTLGTAQDEQIVDSIGGDAREHFMLHYNFPPYSVGESTPLKAPGRREIGHGKLAWRAIRPLLPTKEEFPYTLRVVSEITESNGSSSMATVCGTSLALMDAGVPIKRAVSGIAMGLIKEGDKFVVLSDIMGDEDHLGDMDFKVAGTEVGITALQMDIKINGITGDIMEQALNQAKDGRLLILEKMCKALYSHRTELNENAPVITTLSIPKEKIRDVIGSGGSVIRKICETTGAKIDIEDNGTVKVAAVNSSSAADAIKMIEDIVLEPEIGKVYEGKVVKIVDFGAFVNFMGSRDGLVHISEVAESRLETLEGVLNEGDQVKVVVLDIDNRGKVKLSMKRVSQESGELLSELPASDSGNKSQAPSGNTGRKNSFNKSSSKSGGNNKPQAPKDKPQEKKKYFS